MAKDGKRSTGEAEYESTKAKRPKFNGLNQRPTQMGHAPDSEGDMGTKKGRNYFASAKKPGKKNLVVAPNLEDLVREEKKRLAALIEDKVLGIKKRDSELNDVQIKIVLDALQDLKNGSKEMIKHLSILDLTTSDTYHRAKSNIACSRDLLSYYERVFQQVDFSKRNQTGTSGREKIGQTLQRILKKHGEKIKLELHQLLNKDLEHSKAEVGDDISSIDIELWDRFAVGETEGQYVDMLDGTNGATWATVASNAQRGVRRAVKNLPENDK